MSQVTKKPTGAAPKVKLPVVHKHLPRVKRPKPWVGHVLPPWGKSTTTGHHGGHGKESDDYIPSYKEIGPRAADYTDADGRKYYWCVSKEFPQLYAEQKAAGTITATRGVLVVKLPIQYTREDHKDHLPTYDYPTIRDGKISLSGATDLRVISTNFPSHKATGYLVVEELQ